MKLLFRFALLIGVVWSGHLRAQLRIDNLLLPPEALKHGLKGPVRTVTQTQSPISRKGEDLLDGFSGQNYTEHYNQRGYLQKRISRDDFNEPRSITHYTYDVRNRVTATWLESLAPDQFGLRTDGRIDYEYVDIRNAFTVRDNRTIMGKVLHRRIETARDTVNRILTSLEYQGDTLLTQEQQYEWDTRGYVTKHVSRYRNLPPARNELRGDVFASIMGSMTEQEKRVLDSLMRAKDSVQARDYRNSPEWSVDTTVYRNNYDAQGRLLQQESYRGDRRTGAVTYTYRPDTMQVVHQSFDREGNLTSENTSRQHPVDRHILTDSSRHKADGKWETRHDNYENIKQPVYQYRYDSRSNWIEQKQVDAAGKQIGLTLVRAIDYF